MKYLYLLLLTFSLYSHSIEDGHDRAVTEFFEVMKIDEIYVMFGESVKKVTLERLNKIIDVNNKEEVLLASEYSGKVKVVADEFLSTPELKYEMHNLYKNVFTEHELDELSSFYKTTLGQKVINQMPVLYNEGMQMVMRKSSEIELRTKQIGEEFVEKLKQIRKDK